MLFRRRALGVVDGDGGVDLVNGGTSENRRVKFGVGVERNNELTFSLSIVLASRRERVRAVFSFQMS